MREVVVRTSHHTHTVIGSGSNDPEKYDPDASRETLDHSVMYILAVALEDGRWHHVDSYLPERAHRPSTSGALAQDPDRGRPRVDGALPRPGPGAEGVRRPRRRHARRRHRRDRGAPVADAHPNGRRPWRWPDYLGKLEQLTDGRLTPDARERFVDLAGRLGRLSPEEVRQLNPSLPAGAVPAGPP